MIFTPEMIQRNIVEDEQERKYGEEGILSRIELNQKSYFAKQWRGKHYEGGNINVSYSYDEKMDFSPVSPFWAKLKYYESSLLNQALPGLTIDIATAFDPRIKKNEKGDLEFDFTKGLPVTLSKDVEGDPSLRADRDKIIDSTYEEYFDHFEPDENGILRSKNFLSSLQVLFRADAAMQERFGKEFSLNEFDWDNVSASFRRLKEKVVAINPDSPIVEMLDAGVMPTHPEFNFIPTQETERGVEGVFIEVAIADLDRFYDHLLKDVDTPKRQQKIKNRFNRYVLLRKLDQIYDELLVSMNYGDKESVTRDKEVVNEVFRILNELLNKATKDVDNAKELTRETRTALWNVFFPGDKTRDVILAELKSIEV